MSKSILIIDTPENCDECRLMREHFDHGYGWIKECIGSGIDDCIVFKRKLEDYCPLKPMPEKVEAPKIIQEQIDGWHKLAGEYIGYNKCIDDILEDK